MARPQVALDSALRQVPAPPSTAVPRAAPPSLLPGSRTLLPDQDLDTAVLRSRRIIREFWTPIGVARDMLDSLRIDAGTDQHVVRHLRARCRKPPVIVSVGAIGSVVGVAAHDDHALAF